MRTRMKKVILICLIMGLLVIPSVLPKVKKEPTNIEPECLYHFWYKQQGNRCVEVCSDHELMLPNFPVYTTKRECKTTFKTINE